MRKPPIGSRPGLLSDIWAITHSASNAVTWFFLLEQIGTEPCRFFSCRSLTPLADLFVIPAEQHIRYFPAPEICGTGVFRAVQKTFSMACGLEGFVSGGVAIANHTGDQAGNRVNNHHRSQLPTCQNIVTDRQFFVSQVFRDPF